MINCLPSVCYGFSPKAGYIQYNVYVLSMLRIILTSKLKEMNVGYAFNIEQIFCYKYVLFVKKNVPKMYV